jgi:glycosyltransferase involved in cell wall biosynthesis
MHNSAAVIARTLERWQAYFTSGYNELILVENGSTDLTWPLVQELAHDSAHLKIVLLQSEKGMGNALRAGIQASRGTRILLSADDLPFDFDDLKEARKLASLPPLVIGSKAHAQSRVSRARTRHVFTAFFRAMRVFILRSEVGDSQGTVLVDGAWARAMSHRLTEPGFLFTTQLIFAAEAQNLEVVEVPVRLSREHAPKKTTVRWADTWRMGSGLFRLRGQASTLSIPPEVAVPNA